MINCKQFKDTSKTEDNSGGHIDLKRSKSNMFWD